MAEDRKLKTGMTAQKKQAVIEQLWLTYFNDTLYAKGLITEEQRNAMRLTIRSRTAAKMRLYVYLLLPGGDCDAQSPSAFAALEKVVEP